MKERGDELTNQANSSNLEREGDIFMTDGPTNGPEFSPPPPEDARDNEMQEARIELSNLPPLPEDAPIDLRRVYGEQRQDLLKRAGIRLGPANWANKDIDQPITITGYLGKGPDGRDYVSTQEFSGGTPLDEVLFSQSEAGGGGSDEPPKPPTDEGPKPHEPEEPKDTHEEGVLSEKAKEWLQKQQDEARKRLEQVDSNYRAWMSSMGVSADVADELAKEAYKENLEGTYRALRTMAAGGESRPIAVPESLEELAQLIMKRSKPEWRKGGPKALIKYKRNEVGEETDEIESVNTVNLLDWSRHNVLRVHNNTPTDPINFFSDIGTNVRTDMYAGAISFYEITFGESYFLQDKGAEGKVVNKEYEALHDQLLYETFLLMLTRNPDIVYTTTSRGERDKMLQAATEAMIKNPLTRNNFFEFIFSMPSTHRKSIADLSSEAKGRELLTKREGNFFVGSAARRALAAYLNIHSYDQLKKILGEDSPLFSFTYTTRDEDKNPLVKGLTPDPLNPNKRANDWFIKNEDGSYSVKLGHINKKTGEWVASKDGVGVPHPKYMDHLNLFIDVSPDQLQQAEIRERIRLSIMQKEGISYEEAELAELFAYSLTHTTGVAARQDTNSVCFDWWTRIMNLKDKRKREKAERRGAKYGSRYNMEGLKRVGLTFFDAARDRRQRSVRSILQGGAGDKIDIDGNPIKNNVDYERERVGGEDLIVFRNPETEEKIDGLYAKDYELYSEEVVENGKKIQQARVRYKDLSGRTVDIGNNIAKVKITKVDMPVEFSKDLEKQFVPTHVINGAKVYTWITDNVQLHLPEIVTGYDTHQNPIIDQKKADEVKEGIMHDLKYVFSTWGEINFAEEDMEWERHEVRNEQGKLVARKKGIGKDENGKVGYEDLLLDEDWYILDKYGRRTDARDEPKTYLESKVMTKLESMFGVEALRFIQYEIEKRGLVFERMPVELTSGVMPNVQKFTGRDWQGKEQEVVVDLSFSKGEKSDEFKTAVWRGAFDYIVASEIAAHRDRGSGYEYYNSHSIARSADALVAGEMITPDEVKKIREVTKTKARNVYPADIGYLFAAGGLEGFWKILNIAYKDLLS